MEAGAWQVPLVVVGRDHGASLLERLFDLTADDARRGYTLEVRVSNRKAIDLYERLGFRSRGLRRGYYTDNREDALANAPERDGDYFKVPPGGSA